MVTSKPRRSQQASNLLVSLLFSALLSHLSSACCNNPPDPTAGTPPTIILSPPPAVSYGTPPTYGTPKGPTHHTPTPSHGGYCTPPANCGTPPSGTTPHHDPPSHSGGGYHHAPPTTPYVTPSTPTPPFDPNSPPLGGTCDFWRSHPTLVWGVLGWWGTTTGGALGLSNLPGFGGSHPNLLEALSNTRTDGIGALYREGTASLLNSMVNKNFPFTTVQVRDDFIDALGSNKAAAAQARVFKLANEGHYKPPRV